MILILSSLYMRYLVHICCIDFVNVCLFAGILVVLQVSLLRLMTYLLFYLILLSP